MKNIKKLVCVFLSLLLLTACAKTEDIAGLSQEEIDRLNNEFAIAYEKGDYIGMNKVKRSLGDKDYDYSHGGILSEYAYSYTDDEDNVHNGMVYMLNLDNSLSKAESTGIADKQGIEDNDFVALDFSCFKNPCFQVRHSYRAEYKSQMDAIVDILLEYDNTHDTPWQRSKKSMMSEWFLHNLS